MEKDYLKLGIRDFCEQMMEGKFADSDIYIYADNVPNREEFLQEVTVAAILSDTPIDYISKIEARYGLGIKYNFLHRSPKMYDIKRIVSLDSHFVPESEEYENNYSKDLLRIFKNDSILLETFLEERKTLNPHQIGRKFSMLGQKVIQPSKEHGVKKILHDELAKLKLIKVGLRTFSGYLFG